MFLVTGVALAAAACDDAVPFGPRDSEFALKTPVDGSTPLAVPAGTRADTLRVGASLPLEGALSNVTAPDSNRDNRSTRVRWSSSHPQIATVDEQGLVSGVSAGVARVVARFTGRESEALWVVVMPTVAPAPTPPSGSLPPAPTPEPTPTPTPTPTPAPEPEPAPAPLPGGGVAELPRVQLDTRYVVPSGLTIRVESGGNLQAALDAAQYGDEIVLAPGARFVGNFVLPNKGDGGGRWITVRSGGVNAGLPAAGTRVTPAHASAMPKILTASAAPALRTAAGTTGWRLIGLEISATPELPMSYGLVAFGDGSSAQNTAASIPSRIVLDRSYVHGSSSLQLRRCVALNSASTAIIDSHLGDCHQNGHDSQAIAGWSGPGPFKIENNYLEAGHEVVMFGGTDPHVQGVIPSDITVRRNHITRPTSWRGVWQVKNLLELKSAVRVLYEGNVVENNWSDAQSGFMVVFQTLTDDNGAAWVRVQDITLRNNVFRNSDQGINILHKVAYGSNALWPTDGTARVTIENNLLANVRGRTFQLLGDLRDVHVAHNTASGTDMTISLDGGAQQRLMVLHNVLGKTQYGIFGNSMGEGVNALNRYAPGATVLGNVLIGAQSWIYPTGNFFPATESEVGFANTATGDYRITTARFTTGGATPGVDMTKLSAAISGVVR